MYTTSEVNENEIDKIIKKYFIESYFVAAVSIVSTIRTRFDIWRATNIEYLFTYLV